MVRSRVFVFLAVTLCCVACLCAHAAVSKEQANKAINDAKRSVVKAVKAAKYELKEAEYVQRDLEWYEEKAEKRVSEAAEEAAAAVAAAATAATAAKNNRNDPAFKAARKRKTEAETAARNEKYKLQNARDAFPNVTNDTATAVQSLRNVLLKARELVQNAENVVLPETSAQDDYTAVSATAVGIIAQAKALEREMENAKTLLSGAKAIIYKLPAPTTEELIDKHKADGLLASAVLDTIVGEADNIVQNIEFYKNQVSLSVETIKKILKMTSPTVSPRINGFLTTAQGDLVTISQLVNDVHKSQQKIMQRKQHTEASKADINGASVEATARKGLRFIKFYVEDSESELEKMNEALKSAQISVRSAHNQRQSASEEHLENDSTLNGEANVATEKPKTVEKNTKVRPTRQEPVPQTEQKKEKKEEEATVKPTNKNVVRPTDQKKQESTEEATTTPIRKAAEGQANNKPEQSTEKAKELPQNDETVKPTMKNPEKEIIETSQNSAQQGADKRETEQKDQTKDKKSEVPNLDKSRKDKEDITKVPFVQENVPASRAGSDGSMIVSVPLLAALIVSAVLH